MMWKPEVIAAGEFASEPTEYLLELHLHLDLAEMAPLTVLMQQILFSCWSVAAADLVGWFAS